MQKRNAKGQIIAGGNPGNSGGKPGRSGPKPSEFRQRCREIIADNDLLRTVLEDIALNGAKDSDRLKATQMLFDYGYGKPEQLVRLKDAVPDGWKLTELDDDDLQQLEELAKRANGGLVH